VAVASTSARLFKAGGVIADAEADSDGNGRIEFEQLPAGKYRIEIAKADYISSVITVDLTRQDVVLPLRVSRTGAISGTVKDDSGTPVTGSVVVARARRDSSPIPAASRGDRLAIVNESGEYRIHGLVPGKYVLVLLYGTAASPYAGRSLGLFAPPPTRSGAQVFPDTRSPEVVAIGSGEERGGVDFNVHIPKAAILRGQVRPLIPGTRFRLNLSLCGYPSTSIGTADADEAGQFEFRGITPGSLCLTAVGTGPGGERDKPLVARAEVDIRLDGTTEVEVEPKPAQDLSITPRMVAIPKPSSDCTQSVSVELTPSDDWPGSFARQVTLRPGHTNVVPSVAPSPYVVFTENEDRSCYDFKNTAVAVSGGDARREILIPISARSEVSAQIGASKQATSTLTILLVDRMVTSGSQRFYAASPDGDGRVRLDNLRSGPYRIVLADNESEMRPGTTTYRGWALDVDLVPGRTNLDLPGPAESPRR
jgi:hypothetical protein